jgi:hypothetical protein
MVAECAEATELALVGETYSPEYRANLLVIADLVDVQDSEIKHVDRISLQRGMVPDRSIVQARAATLVPCSNGLMKTTYPIIGPNWKGAGNGFPCIADVCDVTFLDGKLAQLPSHRGRI